MQSRYGVGRAAVRVALVMLLAVSACDAAPAPTAGPALTPVPGGEAPEPGTSLPPARSDDIAGAIRALDDLRSYRFVLSMSEGGFGVAGHTRGVVVNGDERRTRMEYSSGGAFAGGQLTIGTRTWISFAGSAWQEEEPGLGPDEPLNPVSQLVDPWSLGITELEDLGEEAHAGVDTRHLRSRPSADEAVDDEGFPTGIGFTGVVDVWVAVDGGYLVGVRAVGTQQWPGIDEGDPAPSPLPYSLDLVVEGVDDPANVVDEPVAAEATPRPSGDPAAAALLKRIPKALARLDAYVYSLTSGTAGMELGGTLTVVNRPVPAARWDMAGIAGFDGTSILVVGDRAWSRAGDAPWERGAGDEAPTCGRGLDSLSDDMAPCTFERLTDLAAGLDGIRDTFHVIRTDDEVAGIASTHLRSEAGVTFADMTIPGVTDVWIANDGGFLVKQVFTGVGIASTLEIGRVNDASIVVGAPGG